MKQLTLDLTAHAAPSFGNFVIGANAESVSALTTLASAGAGERFIYLWGGPGSGRSHLLAAVVECAGRNQRKAALLRTPFSAAALDHIDADALLAVDDVERLDAVGQRSLFGLYNRMRASSGALVASGPRAPKGLTVRADLATRLAWGLVFEVHALTDDDKTRAMRERAQTYGFKLPQEACEYALRHGRRDLPSLLALVDLLDRHSLAAQRAVTLPLVREVMNLPVEPARPS